MMAVNSLEKDKEEISRRKRLKQKYFITLSIEYI